MSQKYHVTMADGRVFEVETNIISDPAVGGIFCVPLGRSVSDGNRS